MSLPRSIKMTDPDTGKEYEYRGGFQFEREQALLSSNLEFLLERNKGMQSLITVLKAENASLRSPIS